MQGRPIIFLRHVILSYSRLFFKSGVHLDNIWWPTLGPKMFSSFIGAQQLVKIVKMTMTRSAPQKLQSKLCCNIFSANAGETKERHLFCHVPFVFALWANWFVKFNLSATNLTSRKAQTNQSIKLESESLRFYKYSPLTGFLRVT